MASPAFMRFLPRCGAAAAFGTLLGLAGCQSWLDDRYADSLPPTSGVQPIKGLAQNVSIRRNALGMPLIETGTFHDALFALGYVHASDRLSQMVSLRLLAQGRLAEMVGPGALEIDRFMRTVNLRQAAEIQYRNASPRLQRFFEVYARGVNAYLYRYRDKLPMDLAQSGYRPEYWKPEDSALVFALLNFGPGGEPAGRNRLADARAEGRQRQAGLADADLSRRKPAVRRGGKAQGPAPGRAGSRPRGRRGRGAAGRSAEHARGRRLEQLGYRAATQPQRQEPDGQRHPPAAEHAVGVELRADPLAQVPGRGRFHRRSAGRGGGLQRQAGLGHDHGPGRQPGSLPGTVATPGQPALLPGRRQVAANPRTPGNLLHQGPAADPRGHPRNPPWPAAQQRPGRAQEHPPAAAAEERLRTGLPEHPAGSRQDPGRLLRPVAGQDHRAGLRRHPRDSRDAAEHRVRRRKAHRLAGHRTLSEPQGRSWPAALPWLGRPLRLGWLCRPDPPPVRPGPAAGLAGYRQPPHRAARLRRPVVQLLVLPGARRAHRPARRCQQEPRHPEHDPHAVRPDLAVRRQAASHVRQSRHGGAAAPGHRRLAGGATQPGAGGLRPADGVRRQADSQLQRRRAVRRLPPRERQADIPRRARTGGRPCLESLRRDRQPLLLGASRPPARARRQSVLGRYPHSAEGGQAGNPRAQPRRRRGVLRTATGERAQGLAMGQAAHLRMAERQLENGPLPGRRRARRTRRDQGLSRSRTLSGRRRPHHAGRIGLRLGPGLRHLADPGDAADRRLRPERTDDRREQQRPIRQSGQPALRRRYRRLAQGALRQLPVPATEPRSRYGNKRRTLTPAR
ncbi:hypothetical protein PA2G_00002 [Pseudomonas aeruginosa 2192]|nr:hypothetical protein PA2G_00002 [Pseudomonas aeruginosa 2192]